MWREFKMTIIDLGTVKIRFDPQDIRVSIDGDMVDVGARMIDTLIKEEFTQKTGTNCVIGVNRLGEVLTLSELNRKINELDIEELRKKNIKPFFKPAFEKELNKLEKKIRKKTKYRPE